MVKLQHCNHSCLLIVTELSKFCVCLTWMQNLINAWLKYNKLNIILLLKIIVP